MILPLVAALLTGAVTLVAAPGDGWQAYTEGRAAEAVAIWTKAAAGGDPDAAYGLGVAYDIGQGVLPDAARACLWYRRAGEAGITAAAFNTAVMLDQGRCGARDPEQVALWYGRAAAAGHVRAEYDLAQLYEAGDGVPKNLEQAVTWYRLAAAHGLSAAGERAALLGKSRQATGGAVLQPALPGTPVDETVPDRGQPVPFVWSTPPQPGPGPTQFFIEVYLLGPDGGREVMARYVDQSSTLVTLEPGSAQYAWRIYTVLPNTHRYAVTGWSRFQVAGRTAQ